jgi:hypothetical protein
MTSWQYEPELEIEKILFIIITLETIISELKNIPKFKYQW